MLIYHSNCSTTSSIFRWCLSFYLMHFSFSLKSTFKYVMGLNPCVLFLLFYCQNGYVSVTICEQWIIKYCDIDVTVIHQTLEMFPWFSSLVPARDKSDSDWLPVRGAWVGKYYLNFLQRNGICLQADMWALVLHNCSSFHVLWFLYLFCLNFFFFSFLSQRKQIVLWMRRKKKTIRFSPGTTAPSSKRLTWMDLLYSLQTKVWKITIWTTPTIQDYFHLHASTHKDATVKSRIVCLWLSCNKYMFTSSDHKLGLCRISMLSTDTLEAKLWFTSVSFGVVSIVFKKRSESELWASEGPDSDSDLHVDPSFPRVLWPLPNSDEVNKQVDFKMFDFIQLMSNQMWQTADCQSLSSVALASWLSAVITWTWRDNWWRRARGTGNIWGEQQGDCTIYLCTTSCYWCRVFSATSFCLQCYLSFASIHPFSISLPLAIWVVGKMDPSRLSSSRPSD